MEDNEIDYKRIVLSVGTSIFSNVALIPGIIAAGYEFILNFIPAYKKNFENSKFLPLALSYLTIFSIIYSILGKADSNTEDKLKPPIKPIEPNDIKLPAKILFNMNTINYNTPKSGISPMARIGLG